MIHGRSLNSKISKLNERCLRLIYNDKKSLYTTGIFKRLLLRCTNYEKLRKITRYNLRHSS